MEPHWTRWLIAGREKEAWGAAVKGQAARGAGQISVDPSVCDPRVGERFAPRRGYRRVRVGAVSVVCVLMRRGAARWALGEGSSRGPGSKVRQDITHVLAGRWVAVPGVMWLDSNGAGALT